MNKIAICFLFLFFGTMNAQELNCTVQINTVQLNQTNQQIFKTLEKSLDELVNKTKWTDQTYKQKERIECSMFITVSAYSGDQFTATIQVQSARPIFNSTYSSPVLNFNDKDFSFKYVEFENLFYDPNSFNSNLVSVIAFYCNMILALDADTFSSLGGTKYLAAAQEIVSLAQQSNYKGWSQADGNQNRYFLVTDLLNNTFGPLREASYTYHIQGLDVMNENLKTGKEKVKEALMSLEKVYSVRPNAFAMRVFFDAKSDEIQSIFSGGPGMSNGDLIEKLNRFSILNTSKWARLR